MNALVLLLLATLAQAPSVTVTTLTEVQHQGTLESFTNDSVVVKSETGPISIPIAEILMVESAVPLDVQSEDPAMIIRLTDGSNFQAKTFTSSGTTINAVHSQLGQLRIPAASVVSVRLAPSDAKVDAEWEKLLERTARKDMVAVRKGDVLDHLDGVIGSLNETTLQFQLDGDDIPVKREKVFGLIYSKRDTAPKKAMARLQLISGDRLSAKQIQWNGTTWKVRLVSDVDLDVAPEFLRSLDFESSKFTYLSDLDPKSIDYTPMFAVAGTFIKYVWEYRRDQDFEGKQIQLGGQFFKKGLALHSEARLKYRLSTDYRRFQAVVGIGDEIKQPTAEAKVIVKADGKVLFEKLVTTSETENGITRRPTPVAIDLPISGASELEIFVGFGKETDLYPDTAGDRVYFANARLIK